MAVFDKPWRKRMFSRKSKLQKRTDAVAEQAADDGDDLTEALEAAREAIARASASAGRKVAGVTSETARQAAEATRDAARSAAEASKQAAEAGRKAGRRQAKAARKAADRLSDAEVTRKAADKLFPEKAKQRRKAQRKRRRGLVYRGAGLAGLAGLVAWLASKRGEDARQAIKQQAGRASERGWDKISEARSSQDTTDAGQPSAGVTQLHDGVGTAEPHTPPE
jgi:hypothetical protein